MGQDVLARCVDDPASFLTETWGRQPALHRDEAGFADLLSLDEVDRLLSATALRVPAFRLVKDGASIPTSRYTRSGRISNQPMTGIADGARIFRLFAEGATIVLQGLHRYSGAVARFCRGLELALGHPTQVNAYITPPGSQGFGAHADAHDVFVLQAFGRKSWQVWPPGRSPERDSPVIDTQLQPGDALYLPLGTPHAARTQAEVSGHLTVGINPYRWHDILRPLLAELEAEPSLDERLPAGYLADRDRLAAEVEERWDDLRRRAEKLDGRHAARSQVRRFLSSRPPLMTGSLSGMLGAAAIDDETELRRRLGAVCELVADGAQIFVLLGDRELRVPARVLPA